MTPRGSRKSDGRSKKKAAKLPCPSCGVGTVSEARFCHACGASLGEEPGAGKLSAGRLAGLAAVVGLVIIAMFAAAAFFFERDPAVRSASALTMPTFDAPAVASAGKPPDLSRMTPREAADRLFNRIMTASEQGNRAEAMRFVPMAIEAYGRLQVLDHDARYHLGLIYGVAGNRAKVDQQITALRRGAPSHLLALVLEHETAVRSGDRAGISRVLGSFSAAYDAEMATGRPEYNAHRNMIERIRAAATLPAGPSTAADPEPAAGAREGAKLFATKCAGCHGAGAVGSDKGPTLVHKIYEPGHHGDASFYRAVRQGVRQHHWTFGAMPPMPDVSDSEVGRIISYVRELQRAIGIE